VHLENQGAFLKSLGIEMRTQTLQQKAQDLKTKNNLQLSTDRLIAPDQMGALFKVLQLKT
jgi:SAM-dependent MidA family methyltransferase